MKTLFLLFLAFIVGPAVPIDPLPLNFSPQLPSFPNADSSDSPLVDHKRVEATLALTLSPSLSVSEDYRSIPIETYDGHSTPQDPIVHSFPLVNSTDSNSARKHRRVKRWEADENAYEDEKENDYPFKGAVEFFEDIIPGLTPDPVLTDKEKREKRWKEKYNLPVSPNSPLVPGRPGRAPYDTVLASDYLYQLSAAAYSNRQPACLSWISKDTAKMVFNVTQRCDLRGGNCSAFITVFPEQKAVALVFSGVKSADYGFYASTYTARAPYEMPSGGKVNGFASSYAAGLWKDGLEEALHEQYKLHPDFMLWITGHAIGGSMATIMAAHIGAWRQWPTEKMYLVTFGEPRTGDFDFNVALYELKFAAYRVVRQQDYLVQIHPKDESSWLTFPKGYAHLNFFYPEVFFDNDMMDIADLEMCKSKRRKQCSDWYADRPRRPENDDHQKRYFGLQMGAIEYGETGCNE